MEKNSVSKKNRQVIDSYDYLGNSASANDCTGLIPSAPQSEAELQSYEDVYAFTSPKIRAKKEQKDSYKEAILQGHCKMALFSIRFSIIC